MEQNVLITKMIGIVVAVIVAAVVLIPICNSLTEGDGDSGGGGGGGGSGSDGILVNDVSELFSDIGIHIPDEYNSWALYSNYEEMSNPDGFGNDIIKFKPSGNLDMSLDDLTELYEMNVSVDDYTHYLSFKPILCLNEDFEEYFGMSIASYTTDETHEEVIGKYLGVEEYEISDPSMISEFHLTYDLETGIGNLNMVFNIGDGDVEINEVIPWAYVLSQEENGFISYEVVSYGANVNDSMPLIVNITDGVYARESVRAHSTQGMNGSSYGIVGINNGVLSDNGWFLDDMHLDHNNGQFEMTADVTITLTDGKIPMFYNTNVSFDEIRNVDDWTVSGGDTSISYLSTMAFSASDDSGDSGGSSDSDGGNDLGTTGTIIGIIPVFVILAILMGAAGLFYQNRKAI